MSLFGMFPSLVLKGFVVLSVQSVLNPASIIQQNDHNPSMKKKTINPAVEKKNKKKPEQRKSNPGVRRGEKKTLIRSPFRKPDPVVLEQRR